MQELYTKAWVLERDPVGEADELVTLYTEEYGKVRARAKSIRKITSKVSSQLQPLSFSNVRFIRRNGSTSLSTGGFFVLDAMKESGPHAHLIPVARLISDMTHEWERDLGLWAYIEKMRLKEIPPNRIYRELLSVLGFDPAHAACVLCKKMPVAGFLPHKHDFVCLSCASKMNRNEVLSI